MIEQIDRSPVRIRKFGYLFGVIGLGVAGYLLYWGNAAWVWWATGGVLFAVCGLLVPSLLKPVYVAWMAFAFVLGWVNTRVLLGLFFYLVVTPVGLVLRLARKDLLDKKIDRNAGTYWKKREKKPVDYARYERLF